MEQIAVLADILHSQIWLPVWHKFIGLFDLNGRMGILFLGISGLVAYGVFHWHRRRGYTQAGTFWSYLGGRRVWWHASARLDYQYYFVRALLHVAVVAPLLVWLDPYLLHSAEVTAGLSQWWGERPWRGEGAGLMLGYGLGAFLVADLVHYWVHRAFHGRWLWEFHKVHHSATVMVPPTASRIHIVEKLAEKLCKGTALALFAGLFFYLSGGKVSKYTLFGVSYMTLLFNSLAANLRHTHVWLSFGPVIEHLINSPAQHQIHHSRDPRHFNHNFGTNLSIWDWMFGTLYVTTSRPEPLAFGVGEKDNLRYQRMSTLILRPFWVTGLKVWRALQGRLPSVRSARRRVE
ncbi:sterol desaturase [Zobellella taiwanensis]|jgi:sterol desaturase/sphingolipid hydroxylase (fatty acid hydroxylase superfamily)|uniref:Sterol desaturase n=1 Tax=Zobellella taiwanensis TaxID=347535 RepID=A0A2P7QML7_9GAMM|nr:sterol desaturase family protein [Zobellella taiwanensis]PSJ39204.1 sterol desaturase [Zobellella taiwanensis]